MIEWKLRRVDLCNVAPRCFATGRLLTVPGELCTQIMVCGPSPAFVESLKLTIANLPLVDVQASTDIETGERVTGGMRLARLNRLAGLHLCGGEFSIVFDESLSPDRGVVFDGKYAPTLTIEFGSDMPVSGRCHAFMLIRSGGAL